MLLRLVSETALISTIREVHALLSEERLYRDDLLPRVKPFFPRYIHFGVFCVSGRCTAVHRYVEFNPVSENVVMTTNSDHSVQLCDVAAGGDTAASTVDVHPNTINR